MYLLRTIVIGLIIAAGFFCQVTLASIRNLPEAAIRSAEDLSVTFLKDTVIQSGNAFSFNTITVVNSGSAVREFTIETELPADWQQVFDNRKVFQLKPGEQLTLPIRVAATPSATSMVYPIAVNIKTAADNSRYVFYSKVSQNSSWRAELLTPNLKLSRDSKETYFQIELKNLGNQTEYLTINFNTSLELTVPKKNNRVTLAANSDTVFRAGIITDLRYLEEFKTQEIHVSISNRTGDFKLLSQKVYSWGTVVKENSSQWYNVPLAIEMISQNVTNNKSVYVTGSGNISLPNKRSISFNYRSDNFYSLTNGGSRYANINYNTPLWKISLGDQTEFNNFLLDGFGMHINYGSSKRYSFDLFGVKSRTGNARQMSFSQSLDIGAGQTINNQSFVNLDYRTGTNSYFSILEYEKYFKNIHFSVDAGLSNEQNDQNPARKSLSGSTAGIKFDQNNSWLTIRSYSSVNSKVFPGTNRGLTISSNEVRFKHKKTFAGLIFDYNERSVTSLDSDKVNSLFSGRTNEYGIRAGFNGRDRYLNLKATIVDQLQDSLSNVSFQSQKLNLNTALKIFGELNVSLDGTVARSYPRSGSPVKAFISKSIFGTVQYKDLGSFIRYENGPFYYYDLKSYVRDGLNINRIQLSPFLESSVLHSAVTTRLQVDYSSDMVSKLSSCVARADINFNLDKQALTFRIFGSYDIKPGSTSRQNILNFSVRKHFGLPLVGIPKYYNLKVVLFKDRNQNNVYDNGDEAVPESNLQIGSQNFITNKRGEIYYRNISAGKYNIDLSQVNNVRGWVAKDGFSQSVEVSDNQTIYIPFKESKYLSGRLNVVRDEYSRASFNPANIRITAINSKGEVFYTLTNISGEFFLNLPADTYVIQINTNVFSDSFRVLQESFNADLVNKSSEEIVFEIRESKRQINIQKQVLPAVPK